MTNKILLMKNIACAAGIVLLMAGVAQADVVYETDFTGEEYSQNTGNIVFDDGTTLAAGEWFGSNNQVGISDGDLSFANTSPNRYRGARVWLDTTGWATGLVTVDVDVSNFVAGADTDIFFQAYAANGVDGGATNNISLDLHGAVAIAGTPTANGTATIGTLGAEQSITGDGTAVPFTFNYNGTDQFVALTFYQENAAGGAAFGSADLDNLSVHATVAAVPEPSSLAILVAGFGLIGLRRRRLN